jgi:putative ABC transport system permease protein
MLKNYFLITYRSMLKNKLFILVNVLGMGIAVALAIVAYFAREYDTTFNHIHQNRHTIYRVSSVREFEDKLTRFGVVSFPLGEIVRKTIPDVDQSSRYFRSGSNFKQEDELFPANLAYVDPEFFKLFTFEFIEGQAAGVSDKTSVVISETVAIRLFGSSAEALGKTISQVYQQELKEVKVAGVYKDPPMNSSFYKRDGSSYMSFDNYSDEYKNIREDDWKNTENTLFLQINDASRVSYVYKQLQPYIANNNKVRDDFILKEFALDPFSTMAHRDRAEDVRTRTWGAPPISAVIGSSVMGILILLIACFNMTNTSIAISARRLKEIGIRKVMGSGRAHLIFQYLGETLLICFLALVVGFILADLLVQGWNLMWQYFQLTPNYLDNPSFLIFLVGVLVFTGIVSGSYPAFYISKFQPVKILKGKMELGGTNFFTRMLLGFQFATSLVAIVSAIGFIQNARFQRAYDLGFDVRGSIITPVSDQSQFDTYRNAVQANPEVISIAGARSGIFSNRANDPVKWESAQQEVDIIEVGDHYLETMQLKLVEGRDFIKDSETDRKESIIVTQKMVDMFGWDKPIGKQILFQDTVKLYVIGVVKDVYTSGLWRELEPMMIRYVLPDQYTQLVVSTRADKVAAIHAFMGEEWNKTFPNRLYPGRMLVDDLRQVDEVNLNIVYMFVFVGALSLLLSATGLFTMLSLNIIKRMKEIGVRKVMGASVWNIARIINTEFVVILLLAAVAGSLGGYLQSKLIMGSIWRYYQATNASTFIVSVSLMFIFSFTAIAYKVFKTANMNPVDSLKEE